MNTCLGRLILIAILLFAWNDLGLAQDLSATQQKSFKSAESFIDKAEKTTSNMQRKSLLKNAAKYLDPLLKAAPENPQLKDLKARYETVLARMEQEEKTPPLPFPVQNRVKQVNLAVENFEKEIKKGNLSKATTELKRVNKEAEELAKLTQKMFSDHPDVVAARERANQAQENLAKLRESLLDAEMAAVQDLLKLAEQQLDAKDPASLQALKQIEQKFMLMKQYGMERNHPKVEQANALLQEFQRVYQKYNQILKNAQDTQKKKDLEQQISANLNEIDRNLQVLEQTLQNYRAVLRMDDPAGTAQSVMDDAQTSLSQAEKKLASISQRFGEHPLIQEAAKKLADAKNKVEDARKDILRTACEMKVQDFMKKAEKEMVNAKNLSSDGDQQRNKRYALAIAEYNNALVFLQENAKLTDVSSLVAQTTAERAKLLEKILIEIGEIAVKSLEGGMLHRLVANLEDMEKLVVDVIEVATTLAMIEEKMIEAGCKTTLQGINEHGITGWESNWNMLKRATEKNPRRNTIVDKHRRSIVLKTLESTLLMLGKNHPAKYRESMLQDYLTVVDAMASGNPESVKLVEEYKAKIAKQNQDSESAIKKQHEAWVASLSSAQKKVLQQWNKQPSTSRNNGNHWIYLKEGESVGLFTVYNYHFDEKGNLTKEDVQKREMFLPILYNGQVVGYVLPNHRGNEKTDYLYNCGGIYNKDKYCVGGYSPETVQKARFSGYYIEERFKETWLKAARFSLGEKDATIDYYPNWALGDTTNYRTYHVTVPDLAAYKDFVEIVKSHYEHTETYFETTSIAAAAYILLARH